MTERILECEDGDKYPETKLLDYAYQSVFEGMQSTYYKSDDGKFYCIVLNLEEVTQDEINHNGPEEWHGNALVDSHPR